MNRDRGIGEHAARAAMATNTNAQTASLEPIGAARACDCAISTCSSISSSSTRVAGAISIARSLSKKRRSSPVLPRTSPRVRYSAMSAFSSIAAVFRITASLRFSTGEHAVNSAVARLPRRTPGECSLFVSFSR